jgi:Skp family chaperone for outer membrane proteins
MTKCERVCVYGGIGLALAAGLGWRGVGEPAAASNVSGIVAPMDAMRLATVDILSLVQRLVTTEPYTQERDTMQTEQNKRLQPLAEELEKMQTEAQDLRPESDRFKALDRQFGELNREFARVEAEARALIERQNTQQVAGAYARVLEEAEKLATGLGYSHVIATRSGPPKILSDNIPGAVQEILARPIVKSNAADDLTDRLAKVLGIENVEIPGPDDEVP